MLYVHEEDVVDNTILLCISGEYISTCLDNLKFSMENMV